MPAKKYIVAVDLGGTKIAVALFDSTPRLLRKARVMTEPRDGVEAVIGRIVDSINSLFAGAAVGIGDAAGVSVASPGPLNTKTGRVDFAASLGWRNVPIRELIQRRMGVPVWLENDANAAALGECRYGAGHNVSNMIYVTVSTGIGGGIIINRRIYHGQHDSAGEFGHICIEPEGSVCSCGNRGCLQAYASGTALAKIARERLTGADKKSLILDLTGGDLSRIDALILKDAALQGDPLAIELWNEMGMRLGHGISILVQLFDPEMIVIGGGVSNAWQLFQAPLLDMVRRHTYQMLADDLRVVPAALGAEAGLYGAAALVLDKLGMDTTKTRISCKSHPEPTLAFRLRQGYGGQVGHPSAGGELKKFRDKNL